MICIRCEEDFMITYGSGYCIMCYQKVRRSPEWYANRKAENERHEAKRLHPTSRKRPEWYYAQDFAGRLAPRHVRSEDDL